MLKSLQIKASINELKEEISLGISKKIDMTAKAQELECLAAQYAETLEEETKAKQKNIRRNEDLQMSNLEARQGFNRVIKSLLAGRPVAEADKQFMPKVVDTATGQYSTDNGAGGYLIPEEFLQEYALNEGIVNLAELVDVVPVSYPTGKIPTIDYSQEIVLADFVNDNDTEIAKKSAVFGQVPYTLGTRGAIISVARELIQDSATDVVAVINRLFARAEIETCNKDIITAAATTQQTDTANFGAVAVLDKIKVALKSTLDMTYAPNAKILMCQKDWALISNLKDQDDHYLVQPMVTEPSKFAIDGHEVVVVPNKYFTTTTGTGEQAVTTVGGTILVGDFRQLKKLVRVGFEVSADESAGFKTNSVAIRAIARFVVKNMNANAFVKITHSA